MHFVDSHCHLPVLEDVDLLERILNEAESEGVKKLINIGTSLDESYEALRVGLEYDTVYPTAGIYPHSDKNLPLSEIFLRFKKFVEKNRESLVAIGECGIDKAEWKKGRSIKDQIDLFRFQTQLSKEQDLPLVIHNRNGDDIIYEVIKSTGSNRGVLHCFSSDWRFARKMIDLGFILSFSGLITYKSREYLLDVVEKVPLDKFVIETDSPYLPPEGHRGKKNEPKYVKIIANKIASVKGISVDIVAEASTKNAEKLFNI